MLSTHAMRPPISNAPCPRAHCVTPSPADQGTGDRDWKPAASSLPPCPVQGTARWGHASEWKAAYGKAQWPPHAWPTGDAQAWPSVNLLRRIAAWAGEGGAGACPEPAVHALALALLGRFAVPLDAPVWGKLLPACLAAADTIRSAASLASAISSHLMSHLPQAGHAPTQHQPRPLDAVTALLHGMQQGVEGDELFVFEVVRGLAGAVGGEHSWPLPLSKGHRWTGSAWDGVSDMWTGQGQLWLTGCQLAAAAGNVPLLRSMSKLVQGGWSGPAQPMVRAWRRGCLLELAALHGQETAVQYFLGPPPPWQPLSLPDNPRAYLSGVAGGSVPVLAALRRLEGHWPSWLSHRDALKWACVSGSLDMVQEVWALPPAPLEFWASDLGGAVEAASGGGFTEVLRWLLAECAAACLQTPSASGVLEAATGHASSHALVCAGASRAFASAANTHCAAVAVETLRSLGAFKVFQDAEPGKFDERESAIALSLESAILHAAAAAAEKMRWDSSVEVLELRGEGHLLRAEYAEKLVEASARSTCTGTLLSCLQWVQSAVGAKEWQKVVEAGVLGAAGGGDVYHLVLILRLCVAGFEDFAAASQSEALIDIEALRQASGETGQAVRHLQQAPGVEIDWYATVLQRACAGGHEHIVQWLLSGTKAGVASLHARSACHAAAHGHLEVANMLQASLVDATGELSPDQHKVFLVSAASAGFAGGLKWLLQGRGLPASQETLLQQILSSSGSPKAKGVAHAVVLAACASGCVGTVHAALDSAGESFLSQHLDECLLASVTSAGTPDSCSTLVSTLLARAHAAPTSSTVQAAAQRGSHTVVHHLLDACVGCDDSASLIALEAAAEWGHVTLLQSLLERTAEEFRQDADEFDRGGSLLQGQQAAILQACRAGQPWAASLLLTAASSDASWDKVQAQAWAMASAHGQEATLAVLFRAGSEDVRAGLLHNATALLQRAVANDWPHLAWWVLNLTHKERSGARRVGAVGICSMASLERKARRSAAWACVGAFRAAAMHVPVEDGQT